MGPVLLDTSIYITALRAGDDAVLKLRRFTPGAPLWLSSVVLEELYAGVKPRDFRIVERLERDFDKAGRMLVPNLSDWTLTGKYLPLEGVELGAGLQSLRPTNGILAASPNSTPSSGKCLFNDNRRSTPPLSRSVSFAL